MDNHSSFELLDSIFLSLEAEIDYFIWIETCMLEKTVLYGSGSTRVKVLKVKVYRLYTS